MSFFRDFYSRFLNRMANYIKPGFGSGWTTNSSPFGNPFPSNVSSRRFISNLESRMLNPQPLGSSSFRKYLPLINSPISTKGAYQVTKFNRRNFNSGGGGLGNIPTSLPFNVGGVRRSRRRLKGRKSQMDVSEVPLGISTKMNSLQNGVSFITSATTLTDAFFNGYFCCFPLHPLFIPGRAYHIANTYNEYKLVSCHVVTVPQCTTNVASSIAITTLPHCEPIDQTANTQFNSITSSCAQFNNLWVPLDYYVPKVDTKWHNVVPANRDDFVGVVYISCSNNTLTMIDQCFIYVTCTWAFRDPCLTVQPHETKFIFNECGTYTLSSSGIKNDTYVPNQPCWCIPVASSVHSIDLGELVGIPALVTVNTNVTTPTTHNGVMINYASTEDQGTFHGPVMSLS